MRNVDVLPALQAWMTAGLGQAEWSSPLTWSVSVTGAKAMALVRKQSGVVDVLGASAGAPADFLHLCTDMVAVSCEPGLHERNVVGVGRFAWSAAVHDRMTIITFALYEQKADLNLLSEIGMMAELCVLARSGNHAP